ncbi:uncharacterized protein AB675_1998 [Cyphellophora attinorum]|uniref:BTB domain-containing protein n=1 Tax=Cyphellophora attinorum TaxID=1664694 RepID=A0A0N0NPR1_9EURO|nr:uncharacterized protein AB675_1998 [Phialophora attinorum]KPI42839.1 hypothetical protein AB675_1998 [Phialophora attinorum]
MAPRRKRDDSTEPSTPAKKSKTETDFDLSDQPTITIVIEDGEQNKAFYIHKHLLVKCFEDFREKLEGVDEAKPLVLRNVYVEIFGIVSRWIYRQELLIEDYEEALKHPRRKYKPATLPVTNATEIAPAGQTPSSAASTDDAIQDGSEAEVETAVTKADKLEGPEAEEESRWYSQGTYYHQVFGQIADVYVFAVFYKARELRHGAMLLLQRFVAATKIIPSLDMVKVIVKRLGMDKPLSKWLARVIAFSHRTEWGTQESMKALPRAFLAEVLKITVSLRDDRHLTKHYEEDYCEHHEHLNEEDRNRCQESRKNDYDMILQHQKLKVGRYNYVTTWTNVDLGPDLSYDFILQKDLIQQLSWWSSSDLVEICQKAQELNAKRTEAEWAKAMELSYRRYPSRRPSR